MEDIWRSWEKEMTQKYRVKEEGGKILLSDMDLLWPAGQLPDLTLEGGVGAAETGQIVCRQKQVLCFFAQNPTFIF